MGDGSGPVFADCNPLNRMVWQKGKKASFKEILTLASFQQWGFTSHPGGVFPLLRVPVCHCFRVFQCLGHRNNSGLKRWIDLNLPNYIGRCTWYIGAFCGHWSHRFVSWTVETKCWRIWFDCFSVFHMYILKKITVSPSSRRCSSFCARFGHICLNVQIKQLYMQL